MPIAAQDSYPRLLFFTGGSALLQVSQYLAGRAIKSVHVVTTFDSGGSTAELRRCLAIPAMGDLRNRLLALSDRTELPPSLFDFFMRRLPMDGENSALSQTVKDYVRIDHPLWQDVPPDMAQSVRDHLSFLLAKLPRDFDFHGASLGNFILASVYLQQKREFAPMLSYLERFLSCRGTVLPIVDESLNLACELEDGSFLLGQHKFKSISQDIRRIFLTVHDPNKDVFSADHVCRPLLSKSVPPWLESADLICYPIGSFYSSVAVNLLVKGLGRRIERRCVPKVFIPNLGTDPELRSLDVRGQVETLLSILQKDCPRARPSDFLTHVLVDSMANYCGRLEEDTEKSLRTMGIRLVDVRLCEKTREKIEPARMIDALFSIVRDFSHATVDS